MSGTTQPEQQLEPIEIVRDERAFRVDYEPSSLATGWMLRERHHDGWPVMAGPFDRRQDALEGIEDLITAAPLCCYQDENGYQSCWVQPDTEDARI